MPTPNSPQSSSRSFVKSGLVVSALGGAAILPLLLLPREIAERLPWESLVLVFSGCLSVGSFLLLVALCQSAEAYSRRHSGTIYEPEPLAASPGPVSPRPTKPTYTPAMKHLLPKAIEPKPATKPKPKPKRKRKKRPCRGDHVTYLKGRYAPTGVYLDECIGSSIARQLRERGVAAQHAHELGHRGWPDARHLDYAACKRLIVITRDRDFLALHEDGEPHSGILFGATVPGIEADLYAAALEALKP